jgi:hypothetical protein
MAGLSTASIRSIIRSTRAGAAAMAAHQVAAATRTNVPIVLEVLRSCKRDGRFWFPLAVLYLIGMILGERFRNDDDDSTSTHTYLFSGVE